MNLVRDVETQRLYRLFDFPMGQGERKVLAIPNETQLKDVRSALAKYTSVLPLEVSAANQFISDLIKSAPTTELKGTAKGGWKYDPLAFVTPFWAEAAGGGVEYHWLGTGPGPSAQASKGSIERWMRRIARLCTNSSYLVFAIEAALAAALLKDADLSESAVFHFKGDDSVGKTTAAKVCQSVVGPPDSILDWDSSARRFEEDAAEHNHLPMVLNAAEKASKDDLKRTLQLIVHGIPEGTSARRSKVVQDQLPDLTFLTVILSTGNDSGKELAEKAGLTWAGQDDARFITIPVPSARHAGIFDRLEGTWEERVAKGTKLQGRLRRALRHYFGVLFRPWVKVIMGKDLTARFKKLIDRFVERVEPIDAHQRRIAEKFGLLYASGRIAVAEGLLPWDPNLPFAATARLYRRAIKQESQSASTVRKDLRKLAKAAQSDRRCPELAEGETLVINDSRRVIGARYELNGRSIIALRQDGFAAVVPDSARADAVLKHLRIKGGLLPGHGGKSGQQLPLPLEIEGKRFNRPRYLIIDAIALAKLAE